MEEEEEEEATLPDAPGPCAGPDCAGALDPAGAAALLPSPEKIAKGSKKGSTSNGTWLDSRDESKVDVYEGGGDDSREGEDTSAGPGPDAAAALMGCEEEEDDVALGVRKSANGSAAAAGG